MNATQESCSSKTLGQFLSFLFARPAAELVDLGPVVGANIAFLGERIGCKIHVEDLYADLDRHARQDALDRLPAFLGRLRAIGYEGACSIECVWKDFAAEAPAAVAHMRAVAEGAGWAVGPAEERSQPTGGAS